MANDFSHYLSTKILDHVFRNVAYTPPATVYVGLYSTDPGQDDTGTELSGTGYERQIPSFDPASDGELFGNANITFPIANGNWGTANFFGVRDALTGGNLLVSGSLSPAFAISSNDQLIIDVGVSIIIN
jgi:formylmethanofuran:tetrahydromethanopterin formyltransferase